MHLSISKNRGFTMIELMVVLALLVIMAAISVPALSSFLPNYRLNSAARDMFSSFQFAKMQAIRNNQNCVVLFNGTTDYTIFLDRNRNFADDDNQTLKTVSWANDYQSVNLVNQTFTNNAIAFLNNGLTQGGGGGFGAGTVTLSNSQGKIKNVIVAPTGSVRIVTP